MNTTNSPIPSRLITLRQHMKQHAITACIITGADPHLSEYPPKHWQTRAWLSGFNGSSGTLVITTEEATLWTDSRYFSDAERQLEGTGYILMKPRSGEPLEHVQWLLTRLHAGDHVSLYRDSMSLTNNRQIEKLLTANDVILRTDLDLPGLMWPDRPELPRHPIIEHDLSYAGTPRHEKLAKLRQAMHARGASHHLVSSLDDIAWITNLRGSDVECNPVFLAHLLIAASGSAILFTDPAKLNHAVVATLAADAITIQDYATITNALTSLPEGSSLLFDPSRVAVALTADLPAQLHCLESANPSTAFKAVKQPNELTHIREVMRHDGAALVHAFRELEDQLNQGAVVLTELDVDKLLGAARRTKPGFIGESFATVAGYQANGAMPHYRATPVSHRALLPEGLLLVDSGGQYLGGTTDITRVLALGAVTAEQKRDATLVLKGMIALSRAHFPRGASGAQLDALARAPLWAHGMDYGHGTGHGVGYFLNVHEGPQSIRPPRPESPLIALEPGMITSIEPGLYKPGRHGIRHENLVVVIAAEHTEFGHFLAFETLSLCPFDRRALDLSLLSTDEITWLDNYHARVYTELSPLLQGDDLNWLSQHCMPIKSDSK